MEEIKEELKSLLMKVKGESEKAGLKLNSQWIMASIPIISWHIDGETIETVTDVIYSWAPKSLRWWLQPWN